MNLADKLRRECSVTEARETLIRLLGVRFGTPENALLARIRQADIRTLRRWLDRVVTAGSAAEVVEV